MDICPFKCGHLPPLYKSAIRISVLFLYNTPPPQALYVKIREINTLLIVFFLLFWDFVEWGGVIVIISIGRKLTCNLVLILTLNLPFDDLYSQWEYELTLTGDGRRSSMAWLKTDLNWNFACADTEGGIGGPDPPPPRKSQVIWVSLDIMIRNPFPGKSWTPPPRLENVRPLRILGKVLDPLYKL